MKKNQTRHTLSEDSTKVIHFIMYVLLVTFFLVLLLVVKDHCRSLGKDIDSSRKELTMLTDEIGFLESSVNHLSRPDRIRKMVSENLKMVSATPESLIVYLGNVE